MKCPASTPVEAGHLELGLLPLHCIVKERRVNYLHTILKSDKEKMLFKFFMAQWEDPTKQDWTEQIKTDLSDLKLKLSLEEIESKSKTTFKNMVKVKIKEYALDSLNEKKFQHSKMDDVIFTELKIQEYLVSEELSLSQKQNVFLFRTRMSDFHENFRGGNPSIPCKMCSFHLDSQNHSVNCEEIRKHLNMSGKYDEIYM